MVGERRRLGRRRAVASSVLRLAIPGVVVAVVVGLVAGAVADIGSQSGPYRRAVDRGYAALSSPLIADSNRSASSLRTLLADPRSLDRITLFEELDQLASDAVDVRNRFDAITPPDPATPAAAKCSFGLRQRAAGTETLRQGFEGVLGGRTGLVPIGVGPATGEVASGGAMLESADAAWASCRRALRRAPGSATLPESTWVTNPASFSPSSVARLVAAVASARTLAPVHRLALVALVTDPAAVSTGGTEVVPATLTLTVHVVVADQGNVDETGVEVGGVALQQGAPGSPVPVQRTLDITARGSTTLTLPVFAVRPGTSYTLQVTAEAPRATGLGPIASASLPVQIQPASTVTVVTASANTVARQRSVAYTAEVSVSLRGAGTPTGTVAFEDGGVPIAGCTAAPLVAGRATCSVHAASGVHAIAAVYSGDPQFASSMSGLLSERVGPA
jgi:hypothetical protein